MLKLKKIFSRWWGNRQHITRRHSGGGCVALIDITYNDAYYTKRIAFRILVSEFNSPMTLANDWTRNATDSNDVIQIHEKYPTETVMVDSPSFPLISYEFSEDLFSYFKLILSWNPTHPKQWRGFRTAIRHLSGEALRLNSSQRSTHRATTTAEVEGEGSADETNWSSVIRLANPSFRIERSFLIISCSKDIFNSPEGQFQQAFRNVITEKRDVRERDREKKNREFRWWRINKNLTSRRVDFFTSSGTTKTLLKRAQRRKTSMYTEEDCRTGSKNNKLDRAFLQVASVRLEVGNCCFSQTKRCKWRW